MPYYSKLEHLYAIFVSLYHEWANAEPRITQPNLWNYREDKWDAYVKARDEYDMAAKMECLRLAQEEKKKSEQTYLPH